ncbi:MAG: MopE-related protein [Nannocystaceae bacterium]
MTSLLSPALCLALAACSGDDTGTSASASDGSTGTDSDPTTTTATGSTTTGSTTTTTTASGTDSDSDSTTTSTTSETTTDSTTTDSTATDGTTTTTTTGDTDTTTMGVMTDSDSDTDGTTTEMCVPMEYEICDNGVDDNCDGQIDEVGPYEICDNGVDDDCDGEVDEAADVEICDNGIDDDCNGEVDDGIYCTDSDNDGIPDADDPFPDDDMLPGQANGNLVYAHTSSRLYTMDVNTYEIVQIGNFTYNQSPGSVTDIALDRWGVLYAITFNDLFVCNPNDAKCYYLADLPGGSTNGLTMIPPGVLDPNDDTLVAIANSGSWHKVTLIGNQAMFTQIGSYGNGYSSSGDVFSISGVGTYGATDKQGVPGADVIVEANPMNGNVVSDIATLQGYSGIYGLAGWEGKIFAFNSSGQVILVDPNDGTYEVVAMTGNSWWGAGVYSVLPQ